MGQAPVKHAVDFTLPIQTNKGDEVTIISTEGKGRFPVIGYIGDSDYPTAWNMDGININGVFDIQIKNVPQTMWLNIYKRNNNGQLITGAFFLTREDADGEQIPPNTTIVAQLSFKEGTGL